MSTDTGTEAAIAAAERIDELLPQAIRAQSMAKLWENDYNAMRAMMLAAADEMGVKPGDKWATKAGTIAVTVRSGAMDWEAKCKALEAAAAALLQEMRDAHIWNDIPWSRLQAVADAVEAPVPQKAASEPFLIIAAAKDVPPPIEQARREGRFEALRRVETAMTSDVENERIDLDAMFADIADDWGGWPEEETE